MKILNALLFALIVFVSLVQAEPGCMDNSWHLQRPFDSKDYHYVQCFCPCTKRHKILADRGKCTQCGHYREPKSFIIITEPEMDGKITPAKRKKTYSKVAKLDKKREKQH